MTNNIQIPDHGNITAKKTTPQIKIEGDIKIRMVIIFIVGVTNLVLTIGVIVGVIFDEPKFGKYVPGFLPIISGVLFGFVGYISGQGQNKSQ